MSTHSEADGDRLFIEHDDNRWVEITPAALRRHGHGFAQGLIIG